ncbi:concanavalin A-like lectin/glucanase domain-containing protein [Pilobolus umbonatus]|nr:concanavalin A-like lectin/glucanase domain-containing protein [Pilobolus umbonatus]
MKLSAIEGSVAGMFVYHPEGEIDIEIVSSMQPSQAYFTVHPNIMDNGKASPLTHGSQLFAFRPDEDYHEYRFDWLPNRIIYYIDGKEAHQITTNILSQPGRLMFNHWTDGNINFSQGPIKQNSYMYIKNITLFFNSTEPAISIPSCSNKQSTCSIQSKFHYLIKYTDHELIIHFRHS